MTLTTGTRLGPYAITAPLGAGGMGEVYRARDTKLGREVALKVLPESFAADPERVARMHREAQVLAALNHPNVAAIHGFEDSGDVHALVLEFVDGETLADRIARGPIPIQEALPIAKQIAEGLEAAHEQGIIHRDLKPANIKVRPDGAVKVLDFGLAKLAETTAEPVTSPTALSMSPTITSPALMSGVGVLLGTAAYMSPEQAKGKPADKRSDIWAFGCVLFEMLTGTRAFGGDEVSDVLASVLAREPDLALMPAGAPPSIRRMLRRCLEKDRRRRLADITDARLEIDEAQTPSSADAAAVSVGVRVAGWRRAVPWTATGILALALAVVLALWAPWRTVRPPAVPLRLSAELGADASLVTRAAGAAAILSPDGQLLAFAAAQRRTSQIYVRRLDQLQAAPLSGTEGAESPFFSPDGQWIGFFAGGKLKKVSVTGGAAVTLCDVPSGRGGAWAEDGTITFSPSNVAGASLWRVSSAGGKPEALTTLAEREMTQRWPQVLPGGKAVLYMGASTTGGTYDDANLVVQPLPTGTRKVVVRGGHYGRYLPSGHLVYVHQGTLFAVPFDLDRLEATGQPVPVLEGVTSGGAGGAQFAVSANGTLVYAPGPSARGDAPIHWMGRDGRATALRAISADWSEPHFDPTGRLLAMDINDGKQTDVWVYDWARDTLSRLTFDAGENRNPVWTPDGKRIVFSSNRADGSTPNLYWQRADGTGEVQRLTDSKKIQYAASWHPSGKFLAFTEPNAQSGADLMILPIEGDETSGWKPGKPTVFLSSPFIKSEPIFSPDGRWLAYFSNESGRNEVYVRPFPGPGGKWQISTGGGTFPTWSRTKHELLFGIVDQIMVASYSADGDSFRADKPRRWSETGYLFRPRGKSWDLHPDGERLAAQASAPDNQTEDRQDKVVFVFNFFDELRRLAPVTKR
jgi:Tol biopolymer transport system component